MRTISILAVFVIVVSIFNSATIGDEHSPDREKKGNFPTKIKETLLTANPEKWIHIALIRESYVGDASKLYRWEYLEGDRDRRGPGAFTRMTECFLQAHQESVEVIEESAQRLEIKFHFAGSGKTSTIHLVAEGPYPTMIFDGEGELYDEFMERIGQLEEKYVDVTPETPDDSLNWRYRHDASGNQ